MTRWLDRAVAGLGSLLRWSRRTGDSMGIDLSPMVTRPSELADDLSRRGPGWPRGVQEDDDFRWRWDRPPAIEKTDESGPEAHDPIGTARDLGGEDRETS